MSIPSTETSPVAAEFKRAMRRLAATAAASV